MELLGKTYHRVERSVLVEPSRLCQAWLDDRRSKTGSGVGLISCAESRLTHSNQCKWSILGQWSFTGNLNSEVFLLPVQYTVHY